MKGNILLLPGDGIGPEVTLAAVRVLEAVAARYDHEFVLTESLIGGSAIDATGVALPDDTLDKCRDAHAVLLGAVGGPKWSDPAAKVRPEQGLLELRGALAVYANLRPVKPHPALIDAAPIKPERLNGVDLMVVRELTGGIYFGDKKRTATSASDVCSYHVSEIERVLRVACNLAKARKNRVVSVDKANVLETSRLWRATADALVAREYPGLELEHMLVDAAAMHLINEPARFDVLVTENMFGDILTDEASMLTGSLGMLPSASLGDGKIGLYEPIHGSAPDIAGKGIANPLGTILSAAMLLEHSLGLKTEAQAVEAAVASTVADGILTPDLAGKSKGASSDEVTDAIVARLRFRD